jgi:YD repeat-containing protein
LNRLSTIPYNSVSGVAATTAVGISYRTTAPGKGQVSQVTDGAGTETYGYDSQGRLTSKTRSIDSNIYTTSYEYNAISQQTAIIYPSGKRVRSNYDLRGRLTGLDKMSGSQVAVSYMSSIGYNTAGQVTGLSLGNGVAESYGYSADRLQMTSQVASKGGVTLLSLSYGYLSAAGASGTGSVSGNSGQMMSVGGTVNSQARDESFSYDTLARLVSRSGWGSGNRRFEYDRWGNRTAVYNSPQVGFGQQIQSASVQQGAGIATNRLTNITNRNGNIQTQLPQVYDASGKLTHDGQHNYKYDSEGRIAYVDEGAPNQASYSYDSANRRVKRVAAGVTTYYIWEGSQVIAEYSDGPQSGGGGIRYYLADRLSTRMVLNGSGAVLGTQDHLAFGE